ncbi:MAG: hypothetical protein GY750_03750, partial [Lentisphaerae bacterium]|nr:hypothetical protein [Lentisphaerota bacterium]
KELLEAYEAASKFNWTKEELEVYDWWSMKDQDQKGSIQLARDEGRDEEREKAEQEKAEMILRMHREGIDLETIARVAGISVDRVKKIIEGKD